MLQKEIVVFSNASEIKEQAPIAQNYILFHSLNPAKIAHVEAFQHEEQRVCHSNPGKGEDLFLEIGKNFI